MTENTLIVDGGPLTDRVRTFYQHKEIQRAYNFLVYFDLSDDIFTKEGPSLASFHAVSIEIPNYTFDKDWLDAGPIKKAFPILKHDGFEFTIKFEEDKQATIQKLIRRLSSRNVDSAFGGLAIYNGAAIKDINYEPIFLDGYPCPWHPPNRIACEHCSLNLKLRNKGYEIIIDEGQVVYR